MVILMPRWSTVRLAGRCDCSTIRTISSFSDAGYPLSKFAEGAELFAKEVIPAFS